jgi:hypothetical protein
MSPPGILRGAHWSALLGIEDGVRGYLGIVERVQRQPPIEWRVTLR